MKFVASPDERVTLVLILMLLACAMPGVAGSAAPAESPFVLGHGSQTLALNAAGGLLDWKGRTTLTSAGAGTINYGGRILELARPAFVKREENGFRFTYRWSEVPGLEIAVRHSLSVEKRVWTWKRQLQIKCQTALASDLTISLASGLPGLPAETWLPLLNGVGSQLGTNEVAVYPFAGGLPGPGARLALPMVSVPWHRASARDGIGRLMLAADPYYSVRFCGAAVEWTYPAQAGLEDGCEQRTIVVSSHDGSPEQSIECFFRTVLPEVPPGPKWLHDIALVDYDYMSDGGTGWFHDLDALAAALPKSDRHKVFLCLHGWYDFLGRYCFDSRTGRLDTQWTVFSSYEAARKAPAFGGIDGDKVELGFGNCQPVQMSLKEVHARLDYARARGFRVGMYFADGMNSGEGLPDFEPSRVLRWGGWQGPDSKGRSYIQNPLHPKVRVFFMDYTRALLAEFGPDIDVLNWDETFHIPSGQLGTKEVPGYADRAMMRLVRDISRLVEEYNRKHHREIAFLTSDCLGAFNQEIKGAHLRFFQGIEGR